MKERLIYIVTIVILLIILSLSVNKCQSIQHEYNINTSALLDSIHHYKTKSGQLVATTLAYESDLKDLKLLNSDLYDEISKLKGKITSGTHFSGTIVNEIHDTTFIFHSEPSLMHTDSFDFSNQYRILSGTVSNHLDTFNLKIDKDIVNFDYTVALDKNNNIHITSNNPYVQYNEISGFTLPKQKTKRWSVGPFVGAGVNLTNGKIEPQVGIGVSYGLIKF